MTKTPEEKKAELEAKEAEKKAKAEAEAKAKAEAEALKKATSATVYKNGNKVRVYTEEHNDENKNFVEKCKGYAGKIGGECKVA